MGWLARVVEASSCKDWFFIGALIGLFIGIIVASPGAKKAEKIPKCDVCLMVPPMKKAFVTRDDGTTTCIEVK